MDFKIKRAFGGGLSVRTVVLGMVAVIAVGTVLSVFRVASALGGLLPVALWAFFAWEAVKPATMLRLDQGVLSFGDGGLPPLVLHGVRAWLAPAARAGIGTSTGTVLVLDDDTRRVRILGAQFAPPLGAPLGDPEEHDYHTDAATFGALLLALERSPVRIARPDGAAALTVPLTEHFQRAGFRSVLAVILPTLAVSMVLPSALGQLRLPSATLHSINVGVILTVFLVGLGVVVVRSARGFAPRRALRLSAQTAQLVEVGTSRVFAEVPRAALRVTLTHVEVRFTDFPFDYPSLRLEGLTDDPIRVACMEFVGGWAFATPVEASTPHLVGSAHWLPLLDALGIPRPVT
jgi:hypothetical protein